MEVIKETLWERCLSTPTKPPAKNSNICLSETAYQHKRTRKKCKKTNQATIIQWQRQCLMYKPHRKPWPKSKTSDISKQSPSPLHRTFLLGRARFTALPLSALVKRSNNALGTWTVLFPVLRVFWRNNMASAVLESTYLLKTPENAISETLNFKMSLNATTLKNLCLGASSLAAYYW